MVKSGSCDLMPDTFSVSGKFKKDGVRSERQKSAEGPYQVSLINLSKETKKQIKTQAQSELCKTTVFSLWSPKCEPPSWY